MLEQEARHPVLPSSISIISLSQSLQMRIVYALFESKAGIHVKESPTGFRYVELPITNSNS